MSEPVAPPEHAPNPFEGQGLELLSPNSALAVAEIHLQLAEIGDDSTDNPETELRRSLLRYELDAIELDMARVVPVFVPEGMDEVDQRVREGSAALVNAGIHERQLHPGFIIGNRAAEARWRIKGVDPDSLPNPHNLRNQREVIEQDWSEAARARRDAERADIKAQIAALWAEQRFLDRTTGKEDEGIKAQLQVLQEESERIKGRAADNAHFSTAPSARETGFH